MPLWIEGRCEILMTKIYFNKHKSTSAFPKVIEESMPVYIAFGLVQLSVVIANGIASTLV